MKIIYLHDPEVGESVLPKLEETFPMLETVAIDLDDDFLKEDYLNSIFRRISLFSFDNYNH